MATENCIRRRAYEIWEQKGKPEGRSEEHWVQARREIEGPQRRRFLWLASAGAVLATALLPGLANIMWQVGGHVYDTYSVELFRTDPTEIRIPVSQPFYDSLHEIAEFHCVVVRYGTEEALRAYRFRFSQKMGSTFCPSAYGYTDTLERSLNYTPLQRIHLPSKKS